MILLDTTRADRLSPYGYERPTTPALQRIADEGLTFTRAYAAAPWTLPSHASIFTGHYATAHNAIWEHQYLDDRLPTLAEHLTGTGLRTAAFSQHVWLSEETGLMRGFEQHYDLYWRSTTALVAVWRLAENTLNARRGLEDKGAARVSETFMDWIDRRGDEPFFAFINYVEPHAPYKPLSPHREEFLGPNHDTPWGRVKDVAVQRYNAGEVEYTAEELGIISSLYDGAVAYQDRWMGEVLDHLRGRGILDDTLLIVTSDHGENLGDHGFFGHEFCVYNTLLHVPLIVRLPGVVPEGVVEDATVENRLLWPMIDLVLAAESAEEIPVERFVSALREEDEAGGPILSELFQRPLTSDIWQRSARRSQLQRRHKCLQLRDMKYIWVSVASDPGELDNLLLERADDAKILGEMLQIKVATLHAPEAAGEVPEFSEELKRRLRSLGYLD
ncbi:MAG: sulfatase [Planctomycetota bacterium]|jgi:arylsulfatase A-like enzyme